MAEEQTTQEMLNELKDRIRRSGGAKHRPTKAEMQEEYERLKHVSETLKSKELKLLWYLRMSSVGELHRFLIAAKKASEAFKAYSELRERGN